jgi:hypothetical protein
MFGEYGPKTWFLEGNGIKFLGKLGSLGQMGQVHQGILPLGKTLNSSNKHVSLVPWGKWAQVSQGMVVVKGIWAQKQSFLR